MRRTTSGSFASTTFCTAGWASSLRRLAEQQFLRRLPLLDGAALAFLVVQASVFLAQFATNEFNGVVGYAAITLVVSVLFALAAAAFKLGYERQLAGEAESNFYRAYYLARV